MLKEIKAFIVRDDFVSPRNHEVSPIYELSEMSQTYSRNKEIVYTGDYPQYAIWSFDYKEENKLTEFEANLIFKVVTEFVQFLTDNPFSNAVTIIPGFLSSFNNSYHDTPILEFSYNNTLVTRDLRTPDFMSFQVAGLNCSIWLADEAFNVFYPSYDIRVVFPFDTFKNDINSLQKTINGLDNFSLINFNDRTELDKGGYPPTYTRVLNIPYVIPGSNTTKPCHFAFNIYGRHGNYDHVLKLYLYDLLVREVGLDPSFIEERFPSILDINEFYIVPKWDRTAIEANLGQISVGSHVTRTYTNDVDVTKFVKIYDDPSFMRDNTYNLPVPYNNLLLQMVNGYHSEEEVKDFYDYYHDVLTISSTHPDFARMSGRTQRFITLLETMLKVADSNSQAEMFAKVISNEYYQFNIISRANVTYVAIHFEDHQYYLIPKYEYIKQL